MINKSSAVLLAIFSFFISSYSFGNYLSWKDLEKRFNEEGLNAKSLTHVQCFFEKHEDTVFPKKISFNEDRCGGAGEIALGSKRVFALIDYTQASDERRMFLVDRKTGGITSMAVAHGKYNASMFNTRLSQNKNSINYTRYYSNEIGSNAPSSGFFIAGREYVGKFGRSLTLHGLEAEINDNACERAVVIHKHLMVTKSQAFAMSSGCPMINKSYLDHVVNLMKGEYSSDSGEETYGSLVFIYGSRESEWKEGTCRGNFNI